MRSEPRFCARAGEPDFPPRNAWQLQLVDDGRMTWVSDDEVLQHQPTHSYMRRIEDRSCSLSEMLPMLLAVLETISTPPLSCGRHLLDVRSSGSRIFAKLHRC